MKNNRVIQAVNISDPKISGFTLIELLVVIAIIGILAGIVIVSFGGATRSARDARRKAEISQIGRFFLTTCYLPDAGGGTYDIAELAGELKNKYPQYASQMSSLPRDPKIGTPEQSYYKYIVSEDGKKCALFANFERDNEKTTLSISEPVPGGGTGVFESPSPGWNGSGKYFQISN